VGDEGIHAVARGIPISKALVAPCRRRLINRCLSGLITWRQILVEIRKNHATAPARRQTAQFHRSGLSDGGSLPKAATRRQTPATAFYVLK